MDSFKDNFYFQKRGGSQKLVNLNIVPVLDMMTLIIFFLASTAVFLGYTKQTVPPVGESTISAPERPPPLAPRLTVFNEATQLRFILRWAGETAGQVERLVAKAPDAATFASATPEVQNTMIDAERAETFKATAALMSEFFAKFPAERTIQLAMSKDIAYQQMISTMDAIHFGVQAFEKQTQKTVSEPANIILTGYAEADAEFEKNYKDEAAPAQAAPKK